MDVRRGLQPSHRTARFEQMILPHLSAAYNLARWLVRNEEDAEDMVQEAVVRAVTFFDKFHGEDGRPWLLSIVRNTCYTWLRKNRTADLTTQFDEEEHSPMCEPDPEALQIAAGRMHLLQSAMEQLPAEFREVLVLRELEGMSYREIAKVTDLPLGTVMSRLSRARDRLQVVARAVPKASP